MNKSQKKTVVVLRRFRKLMGDMELIKSRAKVLSMQADDAYRLLCPHGTWCEPRSKSSCLTSLTCMNLACTSLVGNLENAMRSPAVDQAITTNKKFVKTLPPRGE
jgi:hypothetical protein